MMQVEAMRADRFIYAMGELEVVHQPHPTATELFAAAGLAPSGPEPWLTPIPEKGPGVYAVAKESGEVIYVGRARRSLRRRLGQFYRHKHGAKSPHRGGQDVLLLLPAPLTVYWAATDQATACERQLLNFFRERTGALPWANRKGGDKKVATI